MTGPAVGEDGVDRQGAGGRRVVIATFGSLGDLHPYLAVGLGLRERGCRVTIATSSAHREKVEGEGFPFHPIRPDLPPAEEAEGLLRRIMDPRRGSRFLLEQFVAPAIAGQFEDLMEAARGADLLLSHPVTYAAPLVAAKTGIRWAASALQPMVFLSAYDPPVPPSSPGLTFLYRLGPRASRAMLRVAKAEVRRWVAPVDRLRAELGLPRGENPVFEGQFSGELNVALFSSVLASPQPDWPPRTVVTGFPFYDRLARGIGMPAELSAFLEAGPPPVVFTLGSSAVRIADDFYVESAAAARLLGRRAVLLAGQEGWNRLPDPLPEGVFACPYAPHGELFPRAAAVVHQGGVGTTGQALRAGRPMLVVPYAHDQPDNARRVERLGVARTLYPARYTAARAARELRRLLEKPGYAKQAAAVGRRVQAEDGVASACDALLALFS